MSSSDSRKSKKKRHSSSKASLSNASDDALPTATSSSSSLTTTTTTAATASIQVKVVASNPLQDPIVCSFPGGVPSSCTPQHSQNGLTFQWFKKKKKHASHPSENDDVEYVLKGQDDACEYYGSCTASSSSSSSSSTAESSHTKLCVGIYDKQTNVVTFYPTAGNGAVISLQQFVPSYHQAKEQSNDNDMESNGASQQQRSSNALLYADFGSAKKRRVLQSQEANRVTVEAVVGDTTTSNNNHHTAFQNPAMSASNRSAIQHQQQMNMAMAALSTSTSTGGTNSTTTTSTTTTTTSSITLAAELATSQWRQTFLPPYDTMATRASQIYNVETIAGSMVWNTVLPNLLRTIRRSITTDNGPVAIAIIPYLNRHRTNLPLTTAHRPIDDMIYGTDIVSDLLNAAAASKLSATSDETWSSFFQSTILLNYFICLYNKFHQQKFRMPALISKVDDDDDDDDMEGDETDPVSSFRYRQYGSTPKMILQRFLELFTSTISTSGGGGGGSSSLNTKCVMSRPQQQKCLVHIFVLYIMSFSLMNSRKSKNDDDTSIVIHDITPLLNELQMSDQINAAVLLLREAGCIVTRVRSTVTQQPKKIKVELSVPLTFPKMKKKQRT